MAVREIPATFEHICDCCGMKQVKPGNTRPQYWSDLTLAKDAFDYQGNAVADGSVRLRLCEECTAVIASAINEIVADRPKSQEPQP